MKIYRVQNKTMKVGPFNVLYAELVFDAQSHNTPDNMDIPYSVKNELANEEHLYFFSSLKKLFDTFKVRKTTDAQDAFFADWEVLTLDTNEVENKRDVIRLKDSQVAVHQQSVEDHGKIIDPKRYLHLV